MADAGTRPFDAREVAESVAESIVATPRGRFGAALGLATREGRRLMALAAAALLLAALLGLALALVGSRHAETGRLAFVRNGDIWVANLDGTAAKRIVAHDPAKPGSGCAGARLSPDGTRLAAAIDTSGPGPAAGHRKIAFLTADGVSLGSFDVELGSTPVEGPAIAFAGSPDGNHVAVLAPQATLGGLWLLDNAGRLERELDLPPGYRAAKPTTPLSISWSPDGRQLAITGCPCGPENNGGWILAIDGSGDHAVQAPGAGNAVSVAWSPDGRELAIGSAKFIGPFDPGTPGELWLTDVDGGSAQRVAMTVELLQVSDWSRDGTWIAFLEPSALDMVRADGSGTPVRIDAGTTATRWTARQRLFYLVAPPNLAGADPSANGQAVGSIMVVDPAGGDPGVVVDGVDAFAPFDLHQTPGG